MSTVGPYILPTQDFTNPLTKYSPGVPIFGATGVLLSFENVAGTAAEWINTVDLMLDASTAGLGATSAQATGLLASTSLTTGVAASFGDILVRSLDIAKAGYVLFTQAPGGLVVPTRSIWQWLYLKVAKSTGAGTCKLRVKAFVEYPGDSDLINPPQTSYLGSWV